MPGRTLPTLSRAELEAHNSDKDCWVAIGENVYDVTDFLEGHPGGPELITDWAGKDITAILKDEISHTHSDSAYEILEEYHVAFVSDKLQRDPAATNGSPPKYSRTGMSREEDMEVDTDFTADYKKHKFIDLSQPMLPQIWCGGFSKEFYLDQIHRPRHYKGGASAPLFGNFLEPLSKTPWWVVPMVWLPCIAYGVKLASEGMSNTKLVVCFGFGFSLWSLIEYVLHRFLFHLDYYLPDNRVGLTLHFLLHGVHHYLPMDKYRLVMPPTLFVVLATPFWKLAHAIFYWDWYIATGVYCGGIFGYVCYDLTHYFLHHTNLPLWYKELKRYHLAHHFMEYDLGYGVTTKFWDRVFGTELILETKQA